MYQIIHYDRFVCMWTPDMFEYQLINILIITHMYSKYSNTCTIFPSQHFTNRTLTDYCWFLRIRGGAYKASKLASHVDN